MYPILFLLTSQKASFLFIFSSSLLPSTLLRITPQSFPFSPLLLQRLDPTNISFTFVKSGETMYDFHFPLSLCPSFPLSYLYLLLPSIYIHQYTNKLLGLSVPLLSSLPFLLSFFLLPFRSLLPLPSYLILCSPIHSCLPYALSSCLRSFHFSPLLRSPYPLLLPGVR